MTTSVPESGHVPVTVTVGVADEGGAEMVGAPVGWALAGTSLATSRQPDEGHRHSEGRNPGPPRAFASERFVSHAYLHPRTAAVPSGSHKSWQMLTVRV